MGVAREMGISFPILLLWLNLLSSASGNVESDALMALKKSLQDPLNVMQSWDTSTSFVHHQQTNEFTRVDLQRHDVGAQNASRTDPSLITPCSWSHVTCDNNNVIRIDLQNMNLSGQLVSNLGSLSNLQYLELSNNNLSGKIPHELGNLTSLVNLDLYLNKLSGSIPDELGKLLNLRVLRLNNNSLSGKIPMSLTSTSGLQTLELSNNHLSGICPNNGSFANFTTISFEGNSLAPCQNPNVLAQSAQVNEVRNGATGAIAGGIAAGATLLFVALMTALFWWQRKKYQDRVFDFSAEDNPEFHPGDLNWYFPRALKRFSLRELQDATDNFDPKNIVGRGGFGDVYRGSLPDGSVVAVKRLKNVHSKVEELQFQTEVEMISLVFHRNLLRLQGFCMTPTEKLLVYPYMANGSVASCLRALQGSQALLDWPKRKQIALGSARGLSYLHHEFDPTVIHRDVKAQNILLDEEFEAVVGDFGLAILTGFKDSHVSTVVCGTIGHIAPEYFLHRKCSEKTDVFGYGVMLLELTSGHTATDLTQLAIHDGFMLHDWVKGLLKDKKLERLVDDNLQGNYVEEEVEQLIQVALLCTQSSPLHRPTMFEVVRMLQGDGLAKRWEKWQKQQVYDQESNHALRPHVSWIVDSTSQLCPDEISGPR